MQLKPYQEQTLAILRQFLEEARIAGAADAYNGIVELPEQAARLPERVGAKQRICSGPSWRR